MQTLGFNKEALKMDTAAIYVTKRSKNMGCCHPQSVWDRDEGRLIPDVNGYYNIWIVKEGGGYL